MMPVSELIAKIDACESENIEDWKKLRDEMIDWSKHVSSEMRDEFRNNGAGEIVLNIVGDIGE